MADPLTQASPEGSLPVAKGPQDVKGRFRKGPEKGLAGMIGKDLSWFKGCSRMKVRGWRQRDQGGAARARADRRWESGVHQQTERPTGSAALPAPEETENFAASPRPVSNTVGSQWGPGSGARTWGLRLSQEPPQKTSKAPIAGTGGRECRDRMRLAVRPAPTERARPRLSASSASVSPLDTRYLVRGRREWAGGSGLR